MRPKRSAELAPQMLRKSTKKTTEAPKGMWFIFEVGRASPFRARWRVGGKTLSESFKTESERAAFAVEWLKKRKAFGDSAFHVSPREAESLVEFSRITAGADVLAVAREWVELRRITGETDLLTVAREWCERCRRGCGVSLADAVEKYRAAIASRKTSPDSVKQRDLHLGRLLAAFPDAPLAALDADALNAWLRDLAPPRAGATVAPRTKRSHRSDVGQLLEYAVGAGWLLRSPMSAVPVPEPEDEDVTILTVEQARALFDSARGTRCVGRLALEAFGGLRFSSAQRITLADLDPAAGGITFPASKHKTKKRFYCEGFPANLWGWVQSAPASCWRLPARLYALDKRAIFEASGLKGEGKDAETLRNCLRHSFATYHLALHRDAARTACLLTHREPSMLYQHYAGRATQAAAVEYFKITP